MTSVAVPGPESRSVIDRDWKTLLRNSANTMLTSPLYDGPRANFANNHCAIECHDSPLVRQTKYALTAIQMSAIYFKRHKGSNRRTALFRQLRPSPKNQSRDVRQQTFGNADIKQGLRSGQLSLRGFVL